MTTPPPLDLASMLVSYPELALVRSSLLRAQLDAASDISGFFDPIDAPAPSAMPLLAGAMSHTIQ